MQSHILSMTTKLEVYAIIEQCLEIDSEEKFSTLFRDTKKLFGHKMAAIGIGDVRKKSVFCTTNVGFPHDFMQTIVGHSNQMLSPLFHRWLAVQSPQLMNMKEIKKRTSSNSISPYLDFAVQNVMSHGLVDIDKKYVTYFGFAQIPESLGNQHIHLLKLLAPHLHVAYAKMSAVQDKINSQENKNAVRVLTHRELEVLNRLFEGKSNWDIGGKMNISEFTVKNHVQNILKKLNASSRQHAVAIALNLGIIRLN